MEIKKGTKIWIVVLVIGVILVVIGLKGDEPFDPNTRQNIAPAVADATCEISGTITFKSRTSISKSSDLIFSYKNIDDDARLIHWEIDSDEDVDIGPNIFAGRPIPDGSYTVGVIFNDPPEKKKYTLRVSVDYAVLINRNAEVLNQKCDGTITVHTDY